MLANELRIGNYVKFSNYEAHRIERGEFNYTEDFANIEDYNPIELTEDWLLKFGFSRHHADYYNDVLLLKDVVNINTGVQYDYFSVKIYPNELGSAQSVKGDLHIKYVHQLQNLYFALTGKELELKS